MNRFFTKLARQSKQFVGHHQRQEISRLNKFELLEQRCLLAGDLLNLGVIYQERDLGSDRTGDTFEVTFNGGAQSSELTRLIINSDHDELGFSSADLIFDTVLGGLGADQAIPLSVKQWTVQDPLATLTTQVSDGGSSIIVTLQGFQAGDRLILEVDVDEVEFLNPHQTDLATINSGIDPITSGVEFQGVRLSAEFSAPGYEDTGGMTLFWNAFDPARIISGLDIPADNAAGARDRTAGAFISMQQQQSPSSISGSVFMDTNNNQQRNAEDYPLSNVQIELWKNESGSYAPTGQIQNTDESGAYGFSGLQPGIYEIREQQPLGLINSTALLGQLNGQPRGVIQDLNTITQIVVTQGGQNITEVDFAETAYARLAGTVFTSFNGQDVPITGVAVELQCATNQPFQIQLTDENGSYFFSKVLPGMCSVIESTPTGLFDGPEEVGSIDGHTVGIADGLDSIHSILLRSGDQAVDYNFYEHTPAQISGVVFQAGETIVVQSYSQVADVVAPDGELSIDDRRLHGIEVNLTNLVTGNTERAFTNAQGEFAFEGIPQGTYQLNENQPMGFHDGLDYAGTAGGIVNTEQDQITQIELAFGQIATDYFFSEYQVKIVAPIETEKPADNEPPRLPPPAIEIPNPVLSPVIQTNEFDVAVSSNNQLGTKKYRSTDIPVFGSGHVLDSMRNAWHLSVVDGGMPRGDILPLAVMTPVTFTRNTVWDATLTNKGIWQAKSLTDKIIDIAHLNLGVAGAVAVAADFNGDGVAEIALYSDGYWFIDINGNGRWDDGDLWAEMGSNEDIPVVGDWDGDGKDDIGVYGLQWPGDNEALAQDPGLPDLANREVTEPKNVPPTRQLGASRKRLMQTTAHGNVRADVVDHVFQYGRGQEIAVTGDWNGDGVDNIGTYQDGHWKLDTNGDGRISAGDQMVEFGQAGDIPVVGDFNGDGVDQIGVFRDGNWHLDTNGDLQRDHIDQVFQLGTDGDQPIVGDFDGDGIDDIAVYQAKKAG
jgi:protocatechuate 3,4-dioxygenase beta subunit